MNRFSKEKNFMLMVCAAAILVALFPLFSANCIQGHDLSYHLLRIEALREGILSGRPFSKVNLLYFGGKGYASSLFYPDLLLYFPAILRCMGVSINLSFHLFVALCILLAFISMYFSIRNMALHFCRGDEFKAKTAGVIAAVCFCLAQYHLDDIYTRSAVGEYTAMIFIPILIYGVYDMLMGGMKRPLLMAAGFTGLILCHTVTTMFMAGLYLVIFLYALIYRCVRGRMRADWLLRIVLAGFTALGASAFYWVPVLEQLRSASFQTDAAGFDLEYERLMMKDVFVNKNPALGLALPMFCMIFFFAAYSIGMEKKLKYLANTLAISAVLFTLGSTGFIPWRRLQGVLGFVQFPWRLFVVATPLFCGAIALYICSLPLRTDESKYIAALLVLTVMIVSAVSNLGRIDEGYYSYSDDYYSYVPFTGSVIGGEWLPSRVTDRDALLKDTDVATLSYGGQVEVTRHDGVTEAVFPVGARYADMPLIYYKGYEAVDSGGKKLSIGGDGVNGCLRVYLPPEGAVKVYYAGTMAQHISAVISLLVLLFAAAGVMRSRRH